MMIGYFLIYFYVSFTLYDTAVGPAATRRMKNQLAIFMSFWFTAKLAPA